MLLVFYHHKRLWQVHRAGSVPSVIVLIMFVPGEARSKFQLLLQFDLAVVICVCSFESLVTALFDSCATRDVDEWGMLFQPMSHFQGCVHAPVSSCPLRVCLSQDVVGSGCDVGQIV